jgi:hypothetical protein
MFIGILAGIAPYIGNLFGFDLLATVFPNLAPDIRIFYFFPIILFFSTIGCILGTFMHPATENKVLVSFYRSVRPWGFWKPVIDQIKADDPAFQPNRTFKRDMLNIVLGTLGQTSLVAMPIFLVIKMQGPLLITLVIIAIIAVIMKKTWWDQLEN